MKHINRQTLIAAGIGFVVGLFWFQFTGWAGGLF